MAGPIIRIKRSAVPGKRPTVEHLSSGELALNTFDAELFVKRERTGIGTDVVRIGAGATVTNILYVTKDGSDNNTGKKLGDAKATIKGAVGAATSATVIKVASGSYIEDNPIELPPQVSIVGDSLREVSVTPLNANQDLFHVSSGNYITECSFTGTMSSGAAIVAFNPNKVSYINQSPYIRNCTNFINNSIGMKIDGQYAIGPIKSMVTDSFTQYNQGGIGVSITNEGYAQLVSLFTICNDTAVYCGSGGACDLTNSNSSFGNYALVSDGIGPKRYTGIITSAAAVNQDTFTVNLNVPTLNISNATYDNTTGILTAYTTDAHKFSVGMGISLSGLGFTCPSGPGIVTYPSGNSGYIFRVKTVASGRYIDSYNLIQANRQEIIDTSYTQIAISHPTFVNPDETKCKRDIGYFVDAVSLDVRDFTDEQTIKVAKAYFNSSGSLIANGISGETEQSITAFNKARDLMKLAITNNLTVKDLSIAADPETGSNTSASSCSNVRTFIDNLSSIVTTPISQGNTSSIPSTVSMASTTFSAYVGTSTLPHTYNSGGTVKINVIRPFDGQVVYFSDLYNTIGKITVSSGGTGYTNNANIAISPPDTEWGVPALAVAEVRDGSVVDIEIVSSGRGYSYPPTITISSPDIGINTATANVVLSPTYYVIKSCTPIISGICTFTLTDNVPYAVGLGTNVPFFKQSRLLASGHSLEYIGSGTNIDTALPSLGGVPIQENETDARNGGLVVYTSTDQSGNFRIGDGVVVDQQTGTISGTFYSKSLFSTLTPFMLALGGD
jgi:hypothetical protein